MEVKSLKMQILFQGNAIQRFFPLAPSFWGVQFLGTEVLFKFGYRFLPAGFQYFLSSCKTMLVVELGDVLSSTIHTLVLAKSILDYH